MPFMKDIDYPDERTMNGFSSLTTVELGPNGITAHRLGKLRSLPSLTALTLHTYEPSTQLFLAIRDHLMKISELKVINLGEWSGPPVEDGAMLFPQQLRKLSVVALFPVPEAFLESMLLLKHSLLLIALNETRPISRSFVEAIVEGGALDELDLRGCELPRAISLFLLTRLPPHVQLRL